MEDKKGIHSIRRIPLGVLAGMATIVLASGGATAWLTWRSLNPKPPVAEFPTLLTKPEVVPDLPTDSAAVPTTPAPAETPVKQPTEVVPTPDTTAEVYWLKDTEGRLVLSAEPVELSAAAPEQQLKTMFETLLTKSGDPEQGAFTTIPEKTQLLDLTVEPDGVHVNLSAEYQTGGGSASMMGRLGQVIYTASTLDPNTDVWISVDGKPLTLLGGEGLEVSQPMTREAFEDAFEL